MELTVITRHPPHRLARYPVLLGLLVSLLLITTPARGKMDRPDIVLIIVDDLGWSDLGCYGGEISTPRLDTLATHGLRLTRAYNVAKCFPSRTSLLTGLYPEQAGIANRPGSMVNATTIGEVMQSAGYRTLAVGKHHGTDNLHALGFSRYWGMRDGAGNHFNPGLQRDGEGEPARKFPARTWVDDDSVFQSNDPLFQDTFPKGFYTTDAFTDKAIEFLDESKDDPDPFFLYLAYTAPHDPLHAWPEDIARYAGVYDVGYEAIRTQRYARQLELGLIDETRYPLPEKEFRDWDLLSEDEKADQARRMQVYAAMVDRVDQAIGRLVDHMKSINRYENTLIIFASDNGASNETVEIGSGEVGSLTRWASQEKDWANVSNTPFRHWKNYLHEGGINTPMVLHWPDGIREPGRIDDSVVHFIDWMPTLMDIAGAEYPVANRRGERVHPLRGRSFLPLLRNQSMEASRELFWKWRNRKAYFKDPFKLVNAGETWELYDMSMDRTETQDVIHEHTDLAVEMRDRYLKWANTVRSPPSPKNSHRYWIWKNPN